MALSHRHFTRVCLSIMDAALDSWDTSPKDNHL